jgi:hypothetical protein
MEFRSVSYLVGLMKRVYGSPSGFSSCSEIAWRGERGFGFSARVQGSGSVFGFRVRVQGSGQRGPPQGSAPDQALQATWYASSREPYSALTIFCRRASQFCRALARSARGRLRCRGAAGGGGSGAGGSK